MKSNSFKFKVYCIILICFLFITCFSFNAIVFANTSEDAENGFDSEFKVKPVVDFDNNTITFVYNTNIERNNLQSSGQSLDEFLDVNAYSKYYFGVSYLLQTGILENDNAQRFSPDSYITIGEFASWVAAAYKLNHNEAPNNTTTCLTWASSNGIINDSTNSNLPYDINESLTWEQAVEIIYRHSIIENNALITGDYDYSGDIKRINANNTMSLRNKAKLLSILSSIVYQDDIDKLNDNSTLTKGDATRLLTAYMVYVKKPTIITGINSYEFEGNPNEVSNDVYKEDLSDSAQMRWVGQTHSRVTQWGFLVLQNDKSGSITNLSGKYSEVARENIDLGCKDPDKNETEGNSKGHYGMYFSDNPSTTLVPNDECILNKYYQSDLTAYTRFNSHYYNAIVAYQNSGYIYGYKELGRALHYLEDLTSPPHVAFVTGSHHSDYEAYANNTVLSSSRLYTAPSSTYSYMLNTNGFQMAKDFSIETYRYSNLISMDDDDPQKFSGTKNRIQKSQRIVAGLLYRYLYETGRLW